MHFLRYTHQTTLRPITEAFISFHEWREACEMLRAGGIGYTAWSEPVEMVRRRAA